MTDSLAERVKSLRKAAGLSQSGLAERSGLSLGAVRNVEQGRRSDLAMKTVRGLANALGVSADKIIG